ncbi:MAG TPA: hypothetical protein VJV22_14600 [Acidobacteriaceae bacterium]|nr:hypothetical protein [Acidobacteriaceae bacterium]
MLRINPSSDLDRFDTLRSDFIRFGCAAHPHHLVEQPAMTGHGDPGNAPRNLVCTLPGRYTPQLVVATSYTVHGGSPANWPDAVLLPILFQSLQAQLRNFTWVFAELAGDEGVSTFFDSLRSGPPPMAIIVLNGVGTTPPHFGATGPRGDLQVHRILEEQARRIAELQGFGGSRSDHKQDREATPSLFGAPLADAAHEIPRVVVYSTPGPPLTPAAFHHDFELLAYYFCAVDLNLNPLAGTPD